MTTGSQGGNNSNSIGLSAAAATMVSLTLFGTASILMMASLSILLFGNTVASSRPSSSVPRGDNVNDDVGSCQNSDETATTVSDDGSVHEQVCKTTSLSSSTDYEEEEINKYTVEKNDVMTVEYHPNDRRLLLYHFESTTSTQDEAKLIAEALSTTTTTDDEVSTFCVTTHQQTSGRGTSGRQWLGAPGNVFVTIGIKQSTWTSQLPDVPLTLLPLQVGQMTARTIQNLLDQCRRSDGMIFQHRQMNSNDFHSYTIDDDDESNHIEKEPFVTVKWPNDVLCNHKKISGTLIESAGGWFLIGIGINIEYAPNIPLTGTDHGRPSTSIRDYCPHNDDTGGRNSAKDMARWVGVQLAYDFHTWINVDVNVDQTTSTRDDIANEIINGWKQWLDWDQQLVLRDAAPESGKVRIVDVLRDGRVEVENVDDGTTRVLVSDYFL